MAATLSEEKWLPNINFQNYTSARQIVSQSSELNMYGHWYIVPGSVSDKEKLLSPLQTDFIACLPPLIASNWQGVTGNNLCFTQGFHKWRSWCKITDINDLWDCRARQNWFLRKMMCSLRVHDLQQHRLCCVEAMGLGRVSRNREASRKHPGCGWEACQLEKHVVMTHFVVPPMWLNMRVLPAMLSYCLVLKLKARNTVIFHFFT